MLTHITVKQGVKQTLHSLVIWLKKATNGLEQVCFTLLDGELSLYNSSTEIGKILKYLL